VIPTLPLRLRNRLAETILAALHDDGARRELAALSAPDAAARSLSSEDARWAESLAARARHACAAMAGRPLHSARSDLGQAVEDAAALFDGGLHFEVHELLEPHWASSDGDTREALQGLIQAAVGFQHLANGNRAGARSLLLDASRRLHGRTLLGRDLEPFAGAIAQAAARVADGQVVAAPTFPR
jgi:predicted metal-dependent hydrolase